LRLSIVTEVTGPIAPGPDAVEPGDGAGRHQDPAALALGQRDPVGAPEQRAARQHHQIAPGAERLRRDLLKVRLGRGLDDDLGGGDEVVERQERRRRAQ